MDGKYEYFFWKSGRAPARPPFPVFRRTCSLPRLPRPCCAIESSNDISAPAQNPRPAPVRMMTRTLASFSASCIEARTSCSIVPVQALSLSGRFRVMVATRSATLYRVSWLAMCLGLYQRGSLLNKVVDAFIEMAEALVLGLSTMEAHVDLLQHHRQLKEREHFVVIDRRQIAPGFFSVAADELIARVPTRLR